VGLPGRLVPLIQLLIVDRVPREDLLREDLLREDLLREDLLREDLLREDLLREDLLREDLLREDRRGMALLSDLGEMGLLEMDPILGVLRVPVVDQAVGQAQALAQALVPVRVQDQAVGQVTPVLVLVLVVLRLMVIGIGGLRQLRRMVVPPPHALLLFHHSAGAILPLGFPIALLQTIP
jgi:hypothetical protein